ncbi:hypothetical protein L2Y90_13015 [Burkholderia pyrrocinia]|uniref:hypothetical protein n=1 Tax=Burkholderia pyrrocinia TaxID=60550 RepID=UPI00215B43C2|nr:hypothetical protein [Burkholderia pyrrocinia]UVE64769.1 hypothetical protein L2Y90_13015 [Burkholderia pyrrocinia]
MDATLMAQSGDKVPAPTRDGSSGELHPACQRRCHAGGIAILSMSSGTRVVRVVGKAADMYYDWKVEVLGSPIWAIDARRGVPDFTNLGFVADCDLVPFDDVEVCI